MRRAGWIAAALSVVVLVAVMRLRADDDTNSLVGKTAPAVSLTAVDGQKVNLADEKGKVVVLDFWATWCPPCRASLPHIQHLSADKDLAGKGLVVWATNDQEDKETVDKFMKDNSYTFIAPLDSSGAVLQEYQAASIPTTVVVGRDGTIKSVFIGFSDAVGDQIDAAVDKALAESGQ